MNVDIIELQEWTDYFIKDYELLDDSVRREAKLLTERNIITIIEDKRGLYICANSYVGRIKLGDIQININPKIRGFSLYKLLKYAYGLSDLKLFNEGEHSLNNFEFFDLLIIQLYIECEKLYTRGISKEYEVKDESLQAPRGRIDIRKVALKGGMIDGTLPCRYFNREEDNLLNRILLSGLNLSLKLVNDSKLKIKLNRLCLLMSEGISEIKLNKNILQSGKNHINRLNKRYEYAFELINIIYEGQGLVLEDKGEKITLHGYFFDMNSFFETFVGKLIKNCSKEYSIKDQFSLNKMFKYVPEFNPRKRRSPLPRPDFALMKDNKVVKLLDAKYRDLWERELPREMLYQLSIYALSKIGDNTATIIYPAYSKIASVQKININDPIYNTRIGSVIMKPIDLDTLSILISNEEYAEELEEYVNKLLS